MKRGRKSGSTSVSAEEYKRRSDAYIAFDKDLKMAAEFLGLRSDNYKRWLIGQGLREQDNKGVSYYNNIYNTLVREVEVELVRLKRKGLISCGDDIVKVLFYFHKLNRRATREDGKGLYT